MVVRNAAGVGREEGLDAGGSSSWNAIIASTAWDTHSIPNAFPDRPTVEQRHDQRRYPGELACRVDREQYWCRH